MMIMCVYTSAHISKAAGTLNVKITETTVPIYNNHIRIQVVRHFHQQLRTNMHYLKNALCFVMLSQLVYYKISY